MIMVFNVEPKVCFCSTCHRKPRLCTAYPLLRSQYMHKNVLLSYKLSSQAFKNTTAMRTGDFSWIPEQWHEACWEISQNLDLHCSSNMQRATMHIIMVSTTLRLLDWASLTIRRIHKCSREGKLYLNFM